MKLKSLNPKGFAHFIALAVVVVGVAAVGTYVLMASHADSLPTVINGYMDWHHAAGPWGVAPDAGKYTPSFKVTDGTICISDRFSTYDKALIGGNSGYHWWVYQYHGHQWSLEWESVKLTANGNRDANCKAGFQKGGTYRVKFDPTSDKDVHGTWFVAGYNYPNFLN